VRAAIQGGLAQDAEILIVDPPRKGLQLVSRWIANEVSGPSPSTGLVYLELKAQPKALETSCTSGVQGPATLTAGRTTGPAVPATGDIYIMWISGDRPLHVSESETLAVPDTRFLLQSLKDDLGVILASHGG